MHKRDLKHFTAIYYKKTAIVCVRVSACRLYAFLGNYHKSKIGHKCN